MKEITKDMLKECLGTHVFDFENDGEHITFKTDFNWSDFYEVIVYEDAIGLPHETVPGAGWIKEDVEIKTVEDIYKILSESVCEENGWNGDY